MCPARFIPEEAVSAQGRTIPFPVLGYILNDLRDHDHISVAEYERMVYWINSYMEGGALPGNERFVSPFTKEVVTFPWLIEDLIEMWQIASNWIDLTDDEDENDSLLGNEDIDLFQSWPVDIGRVCLYARFSWVQ